MDSEEELIRRLKRTPIAEMSNHWQKYRNDDYRGQRYSGPEEFLSKHGWTYEEFNEAEAKYYGFKPFDI